MDVLEVYSKKIVEIIEKVKKSEKENLKKATKLISDVIVKDKIIHVFGTGGHSSIAGMEMFYRAGGLACINPLFPAGVSVIDSHPNTERLVGYAGLALDYYGVKKGDVIIISNVNGINSVTIDAGLEARKRGAKIITICSEEFAKNVPAGHPARHPSNKNLYELGDIAIDAHIPLGDAIINIEGFDMPVASCSTSIVCLIVNVLIAMVVEELVKRGFEPPVWKSANVPGGDQVNQKYKEKYMSKIRHLY